MSGIYFENYVATELAARNIKLFYWKGKKDNEFEFIINLDGEAVPIDVKKKRGALNSIDEFRNHNKNGLVIKVSKDNYGLDEENMILTLPFYYFSFFLNEHCINYF